MSLTSLLYNGRPGRWCERTFVGTDSMIKHVRTSVAGVAPVRPVGQVVDVHWADIGGAFGQRLAYPVDPAPPSSPCSG